MLRKCSAVTAAILSTFVVAATASAEVSPGVQTDTQGAQCTANFVFSDGANTYLGQAAHCASLSSSTETNGCLAEFHPVGTPVKVQDASTDEFSVTGTLAYSSWSTMKAKGEDPNSDTCQYNDLALIKLPAGTVVDPSVPFWGGPNGLATTTTAGQDIYTYGNSSLRLGIDQLKPKRGKSLGTNESGWSHTVYTLTPGIPGDSGSGFLDNQGRAFGVLSTVAIAPLPASNGVGDLAKELAYMKANAPAFAGVNLVNGGPFSTARIL